MWVTLDGGRGGYLTATLDIRYELDPEIQVLTHIRGRVLTRKATLAPNFGCSLTLVATN